MNPELRRNLWLELTLHRLLALPIALGLAFMLVNAMTETDPRVPLAVNHTRRWAPDVQRLASELRAGTWGTLRSAVGTYNKGVLNNGSHLVDLLHQLLGPLTLLHAGLAVADFWPDDPTVPALLQTETGVPVHLATAHAGDAALFELQLVCEKAVITMEDGGLQWRLRRVVDSPHFAGYRVLDAGERQAGEYLKATALAVDNLYRHLGNGAPLASTGHTALAAQRLCDQIRRKAGAEVAPWKQAAPPPRLPAAAARPHINRTATGATPLPA